ncbi:MAG: GNAT family N-acetyltransferase [Clostridia bacterium]|nr:GNAT family N-acetyltransferase [Clostridia bacterium]
MIKLKQLGKNVEEIRPFIERYGGIFNDLTIATRFLWAKEFPVEYAVINDTLIMRENNGETSYFYYPLGKDEKTAFVEIEEYAAENDGGTLRFGNLDRTQATALSERYDVFEIHSFREWSDYIYPVEQFRTYTGKKLSGQRNHVNKFKKTYPDYRVGVIEKKDIPALKEFLKEYEKENEFSGWAAAEQPKVYELLDNMERLGQFGVYLSVNGKIASFSVGERVGDTLFSHVEKGLKEYEGVYPVTAQEFVKAFAKDGVQFVNREEDCGDTGLRTSKMQYHPSEIKEKYHVSVRSSFFKIKPPVMIATERLLITDIYQKDKDDYAKLYTDDTVNAFYGYDYRQDLNGNTADGDYFLGFFQGLKDKKEEYSLAVRLDGKMIGEIVFYGFGFHDQAEIGFRFFTEYQRKGYGYESVSAAMEYAFNAGFRRITCRHFTANVASERLIAKLGFSFVRETKTHKFYRKDNG